MDRRNAMTTLSGAVAASALLLLPRQGALAQKAAAITGPLDAGGYKTHTLMAGTFSKQTSVLAISRATNPKVRQFAQFEADEQTAIAQVLTDETNPPPAPLDPAHEALLSALQREEGKAFDIAYVRGQIQGHQELFAIQQAFLNGNPTNRDREHIAVLARTVIQMHLVMLQDLQGMVGSA